MATPSTNECNSARFAQYARMASQLANEGFNAQALVAANENFIVGTQGELVPKHYDMPPWELSYPAVRLLCLVFRDLSTSEGDANGYRLGVRDPNKVGHRAIEFAAKLKAKLLEDSQAHKYELKAYLQALANMHITLFHPSAPSEPNIFKDEAEASFEDSLSRQLVAEFSARLQRREKDSNPVIELVVDRILMTPGGVLLILFQPKDGMKIPNQPSALDDLRMDLRASFPNASKKQTRNIYHASLLRLVGELPSKAMAEKVAKMCEEMSQQLRGTSVWFDAITYVLELGIIALEGKRIQIDLTP